MKQSSGLTSIEDKNLEDGKPYREVQIPDIEQPVYTNLTEYDPIRKQAALTINGNSSEYFFGNNVYLPRPTAKKNGVLTQVRNAMYDEAGGFISDLSAGSAYAVTEVPKLFLKAADLAIPDGIAPDVFKKEVDYLNRNQQEIAGGITSLKDKAGIGKTDKDGFMYDLASVPSSIASSMALFALTGGAGVLALQSLRAGAGTATAEIQTGTQTDKALGIGSAVGLAEGSLEAVSGKVFSNMFFTPAARSSLATSVLKNIKSKGLVAGASVLAEGVGTEFTTEALQQVSEDVLPKFLGGKSTEGLTGLEILSRAGYAGLLGGLGGGMVSVYPSIRAAIEATPEYKSLNENQKKIVDEAVVPAVTEQAVIKLQKLEDDAVSVAKQIKEGRYSVPTLSTENLEEELAALDNSLKRSLPETMPEQNKQAVADIQKKTAVMMSEMGGKEFETHIEKYVQDNINGKITGTDFPITNTATSLEIMQAGTNTYLGLVEKVLNNNFIAKDHPVVSEIIEALGLPVDGTFSAEQKRDFNEGMAVYLASGKAADAHLIPAYEEVKNLITQVYSSVEKAGLLQKGLGRKVDSLLSPNLQVRKFEYTEKVKEAIKNAIPKLVGTTPAPTISEDEVVLLNQVFDTLPSLRGRIFDEDTKATLQYLQDNFKTLFKGVNVANVKRNLSSLSKAGLTVLQRETVKDVRNILKDVSKQISFSEKDTVTSLLEKNNNLKESYGSLVSLMRSNGYEVKDNQAAFSADRNTPAEILKSNLAYKTEIEMLGSRFLKVEKIKIYEGLGKDMPLVVNTASLTRRFISAIANNTTAQGINKAGIILSLTRDLVYMPLSLRYKLVKDISAAKVLDRAFIDKELKAVQLEADKTFIADKKAAITALRSDLKELKDLSLPARQKQLIQAIWSNVLNVRVGKKEIEIPENLSPEEVSAFVRENRLEKAVSKFTDFYENLTLQDEDGNKIELSPVEENLLNGLISFQIKRLSGNLSPVDYSLYTQNLTGLKNILSESYQAKEQERFIKLEKERTEALRGVVKGKTFGKIKSALLGLYDSGTWLQLIFGKDVAEKYDLVLANDKKVIEYNNYKQDLESYLKENYNTSTFAYNETLNKTKVEKSGIEKLDGLSKNEVAYLYSVEKNIKGRDYLVRLFGDDFDKAMSFIDSFLTEQDKDIASFLAEQREALHFEANKTHLKLTGTPLGFEEYYTPIVLEREFKGQDKVLSLEDADSVLNFTKSGAIQDVSYTYSRLPKSTRVLKPVPLLELHNSYANKILTYTYLVPKVNDILNLIDGSTEKSRELVEKIKEKVTNEGFNSFSKILDFIQGRRQFEKPTSNLALNRGLKTLMNNVIASNIIFKPYTAFKQISSNVAFLDFIPTKDYLKYTAEGGANFPKTYKYIMEKYPNILTRSRYEIPEPFIKEALEQFTLLNSSEVKKYGYSGVRFMDSVSTVLGAYAMEKSMQEQGLSDKEIYANISRAVQNTQQSSYESNLGTWQLNRKDYLATALLAYRTTSQQILRQLVKRSDMYARGEISREQLIKSIGVYAVAMPLGFSLLSNPAYITAALTGDREKLDDDFYKVFIYPLVTNLFGFNAVTEALTGAASNAVAQSVGVKTYPIEFNIIGVDTVLDGMKNLSKGDIEEGLTDLFQPFTPVPLRTTKNIGRGLYFTAEGTLTEDGRKAAKGIALTMGMPKSFVKDFDDLDVI